MAVIKQASMWENDCIITYASGEFVYQLIPYWAQLPAEFANKEITSVGCDSRDNVYVLTRDFNMPIMVFDKAGRFQYAFGRGVFYARPHGIFINKSDELYCTDDKAHVVMKFSSQGELLQIFGTPNLPSDSGCNWKVYEEYRKREGIPESVPTDAALNLKMRLDTIVRTAGPFNGPTRMIEVPDGDLFCSDGYGNAAIHHFSHDGTLLYTFGAPGREPGQFRLPHGLLMDHAGHLWVADRENHRIQIFTPKGELLQCVEGITKAAELCTDGEFIYVCQTNGGGFTIFDQSAEIVGRIGYKNSPLYMHGIAVDSEKNIYGATLGKNRDFNIFKLKRI